MMEAAVENKQSAFFTAQTEKNETTERNRNENNV